MHNPYWAQVVALSCAIAHAEGFWVPGARPRRQNNPGDLVADGAVNGVFYSRMEGFDALAWKVAHLLAGASHTYPLALTWHDFAERWTGGDHAGSWCDAIADDLNVDPATTLQAWRLSIPLQGQAQAADLPALGQSPPQA
jgi:hypothetical protein